MSGAQIKNAISSRLVAEGAAIKNQLLDRVSTGDVVRRNHSREHGGEAAERSAIHNHVGGFVSGETAGDVGQFLGAVGQFVVDVLNAAIDKKRREVLIIGLLSLISLTEDGDHIPARGSDKEDDLPGGGIVQPVTLLEIAD